MVNKKMIKKAKSLSRRQYILFYLFMLPWIVGFLVLTAWPLVYTAFLSFHTVNWTILGWERAFIGIDNFNLAFLRNPDFTPALLSFLLSLLYFVPVITVIAFILALLLNRNIRFRGFFRAIFFLPVIVMSGPVMSHLLNAGVMPGDEGQQIIMWTWMTNIVAHFSFQLAEGLIYLYDNFITILWFTGIPVILFLSALQKIDNGVLEAARIDSATNWQILWLITVPMLRPIIMVSIILTIVQLASYALNPVLPMIQQAIFESMNGLGLASAFAWIYSALVMALIGIAFALLKGKNDKESGEVKRLVKH